MKKQKNHEGTLPLLGRRDLFFALFFLFLGSLCLLFELFLRQSLILPLPEESQFFLDRWGNMLSLELNTEEEYFLPLEKVQEISPFFLDALIQSEDKRFFSHAGIDVFASFRAAFQIFSEGKIVSGASTISQQVIKQAFQNTERNWGAKIEEILLSLRLESQYSKEEILLFWANTAPFFGNVRGLRTASFLLFETDPALLSPAQAAYLALLPQRPSFFLSPEGEEVLQKKKEKLLHKMSLSPQERERALRETIIPPENWRPENKAPHFVRWISQNKNAQGRTSLDLPLQKKVQNIVEDTLQILEGHYAKNAAVIIAENDTAAIRVYLGSRNFFHKNIQGQVDMLQSFRQVGSTLKPFLYAFSFEKLGWNPETILLDEEQAFLANEGKLFVPQNFDLSYRGEISLREALGQSRNIPAVSTLEKVGSGEFRTFLESLGVSFLVKNDGQQGLSLALGAGEMRLLDLAMLTLLLAREGMDFTPCTKEPCFPQKGEYVIDQKVTREITDILSDNTARISAFGENSALATSIPLAAKTGTTRNFRDNYIIAYTPEYTIFLWVGNADGTPMRNVSGITGAGPILADILALFPKSEKTFSLPPSSLKSEKTFSSLRILSPLPGEKFLLDLLRSPKEQKMRFVATEEVSFFLDDIFLGKGKEQWWVPEQGDHKLRIEGKGNQYQELSFLVY